MKAGYSENELSPGERALVESVLSAFPTDPMTDAEFKIARRTSPSEEPSIDDVIAYAKKQAGYINNSNT